MPITVLGADGTGQDSDVIAGRRLGRRPRRRRHPDGLLEPGSYSASLQAAVDYAWSSGVVLVAAAGNDGSSVGAFPAGDRGVIGVSNTTSADTPSGLVQLRRRPSSWAPRASRSTRPMRVAGTGTCPVRPLRRPWSRGPRRQLFAVDPSASNGVVVGRLARNADPAGTVDETGNGRVNLARALGDTSTDSVQPAGSAPLGNGGPFVGPYVVAANNFTVVPATQTVAGGSTNTFVWTFTATNAGNVPTASMTVPAGWTAPTTAAGPGQVTIGPGTCGATLNNITGNVITVNQKPPTGTCANNQTFTITYSQATAPTTPATYIFSQTPGGTQPTVVVAAASANLSITKTDGVTSVTAGDGVVRTYTITVTNGGPSNATGVSVSDTFPAGFTIGTVTPSQGPACTGLPNFTCALGSLAAGGSATISVTYTVPSSTTASPQVNSATVSATTADPNAANNTATDSNTVTTSANLSITKTDGVTSVTAGDGVVRTYTITVTNGGPSNATGVSVSDTFPAGFTIGTVTPSQGPAVHRPAELHLRPGLARRGRQRHDLRHLHRPEFDHGQPAGQHGDGQRHHG